MPVIGLEFLKSVAGVEAAKGVPVVMITTEGSKGRVVECRGGARPGDLGRGTGFAEPGRPPFRVVILWRT